MSRSCSPLQCRRLVFSLISVLLIVFSTRTESFSTYQSRVCSSPSQHQRPRRARITSASCDNDIALRQSMDQSDLDWDGDDIRWTTRMRRRFFRRSIGGGVGRPVRNSLILINGLAFCYQVASAVYWIRKRHPSYWPNQALPILWDAVWGSAVSGPFTHDFVHCNGLSRRQPHRFLTSGFLHGGVLHLLVNLDALRRQPSWLETGLGAPLYLTAFLVSVVTGNLGHTFMSLDPMDSAWCLGSSGGICGLFGLCLVSLVKMGNGEAASRLLRGIGLIFLYGLVIASISNTAHVGGLLGGMVVGILCGPGYEKSYSMRRKNSLEVDAWPRDYRLVMGFGNKPTTTGWVPVPVLWIAALLALSTQARFRAIPRLIIQGILRPGSVTAAL